MTVDNTCTTLWEIRAQDEHRFAIGKGQVGNKEGALHYLEREEYWLSMYRGSRPDLLEAFGLEFKRVMNMAERVQGLKKEHPEYRYTG